MQIILWLIVALACLPFVAASDGKFLIVRQESSDDNIYETSLAEAFGSLSKPWQLETEHICSHDLNMSCPCDHLKQAVANVNKTDPRRQIFILAIEDKHRRNKICGYQARSDSPIVLQLLHIGTDFYDIAFFILTTPAGHIKFQVKQSDFANYASTIVDIVEHDRKHALRNPNVPRPKIVIDPARLTEYVRKRQEAAEALHRPLFHYHWWVIVYLALLSIVGSFMTTDYNAFVTYSLHPLSTPIKCDCTFSDDETEGTATDGEKTLKTV